jgi:hypothetical protein
MIAITLMEQVGIAVMLYTILGRCLVQILARTLFCLRFFIVFLSPTRQVLEEYPPWSCHDCFLPNLFQFIIHPTIKFSPDSESNIKIPRTPTNTNRGGERPQRGGGLRRGIGGLRRGGTGLGLGRSTGAAVISCPSICPVTKTFMNFSFKEQSLLCSCMYSW